MRLRAVVLISLASATLVLSSCGGGGSIVKSDSPPVTVADDSGSDDTVSDETTPDDGSTDGDSTGTGGGIGGGTPEEPTDDGSGGGSGSFDSDLQKCLEVGEAFSQIAQEAPTMDEATAQATVEELADLFPSELQDDFRTLVQGYASVNSSSFSSDEFAAANEAITGYITDICS